MADCNFTIPFNGSIDALIIRAREGITNMRGEFKGDIHSGTFALTDPIAIKGSYIISGFSMDIHISEKPFFISCNMIKIQLEKLVDQQNA